ncbi:hypothetical protein [Streptomyces sp. NPDC088180]|uniref:hypothetical protein n=1 Tax=Streptomyces sp. NPDC088180 TaxID=3365837 RepID=UPI00380BFC33
MSLLAVGVAVLLVSCSGTGSDPGTSAARPSSALTPASSPTASGSPSSTASPTPSTPAEITEAVTQWYEYGGETAMVALITEAVKAQDDRPDGDMQLVIVDFEGLTNAIGTARAFGSVPDPKTQRAWSAALEGLDDGAREVLGSASGDTLIQSPQEAAQALRGWETLDEGVKSLKAAQKRLHRSFGLYPSDNPWKVAAGP